MSSKNISPTLLYHSALIATSKLIINELNLKPKIIAIAKNKVKNPTKAELNIIRTINKHIMRTKGMPYLLKMKTSAAVAAFYKNYQEFATLMAQGLQNPLNANIKFCLDNIIINNEGKIDLKKTILNVTELSQFRIEFRLSFLAYHGIDKSNFLDMQTKIVNHLESIPFCRKRKYQHDYVDRIVNINIYVDLIMDPFKRYRVEGQDLSNIHRFAVAGSFDTMKYFLSKIQDTNKDYLVKTAEFMFNKNHYCIDKIVYIYRNLDNVTWNMLLRRYFVNIIKAFSECWINKDLCVTFYKSEIDLVDVSMFKKIMHNLCKVCSANPCYEGQDIPFIIQAMWDFTPDEIKYSDDKEIYGIIVPQLFCLFNHFEMMKHFIKKYDNTIKKDIIVHVLLYTIIYTQKHRVAKRCLSLAKQLGLCPLNNNLKDLITLEHLRKFMISDVQIDIFKICTRLELCLCSLESDLNNSLFDFKKYIFKDRDFVYEFLLAATIVDKAKSYLCWALGDELSEFKSKLIDSFLIADIYEQRLAKSESFNKANKVVKFLSYSLEDKCKITSKVLKNTKLITQILSKFIEYNEFYAIDEFNKYFYCEGDDYFDTFVNNICFTDDGINLILNKFTYLDSVETTPGFRIDGVKVFKEYLHLIEKYIHPRDLCIPLWERLDLIGEANVLKREIRVKNKETLSPLEEEYAKACVKALYEGFKELLLNDVNAEYLDQFSELSVIEICEKIHLF